MVNVFTNKAPDPGHIDGGGAGAERQVIMLILMGLMVEGESALETVTKGKRLSSCGLKNEKGLLAHQEGYGEEG